MSSYLRDKAAVWLVVVLAGAALVGSCALFGAIVGNFQ